MWIEMKDRKPEQRQSVIYWFKYVGVHRGYYLNDVDDDGVEHDIFAGEGGFLSDDVTHWMPDEGQGLPAPPKGT